MSSDDHDHDGRVARMGLCSVCAAAQAAAALEGPRAGPTVQLPEPLPDPGPHFDGGTYQPHLDFGRLRGQLADVYEALTDGEWWGLAELAATVGHREASVSARLRDLRKPEFGGHIVERRRVGDPEAGLFAYRLVRPDQLQEPLERVERPDQGPEVE